MSIALITDLYELTMSQSYLENNKTGAAVFSLFTRKLPKVRNFLVACGLATLIDQLSAFRFDEDDITYLRSTGIFSERFLDYLIAYRFTGTLYAVAEGTVVFQNEPIVQIEGSLPDVQLVETLVLNSIHFQTLVASKAARIISMCKGKSVVDFGLRRSHMPEAGVYAARAAWIAGFSGTSNCEAGRKFAIPVTGTMAHSYVMVFASEEDAFRTFQASFPNRAVYLVDTYDTPACLEKVVQLAKEGIPVMGVRIDSGDIPTLASAARKTFDENGLTHVEIFVSSVVDEYSIDAWNRAGVPIDAFGVGTHFITSSDAPHLDMVYKLVEYEGQPKSKTSPGKVTFPSKRQVFRHYSGGYMDHDEVVQMDPANDKGESTGLVVPIMRDGRLVAPLPSLTDSRKLLARDLSMLPEEFRSLEKCEYSVIVR